ncbi:MAG TPA: TIGR02281 family clan AA aspartic protease, partial [Hyphomicrobiaceae bacterium]|nr:TIGR02281 family clan AA aspartic protease [Hyphomicrobiaceae bacterium]
HHGHFFADASINGSTIRVLVDTGASLVALSHEDARRAGIFVGEGDYKYTTSTANGQARIAIVELARVSIGSIMVYNVRAAVGEPGALKTTLLGMSFLGKLRRTEMRQGQLILEN